jgi:hypothetical protein
MAHKRLSVKALIIITCILLPAAEAAGESSLFKMKESEVDAAMKEKAYELGLNIFLTYEKEEFKLMGDEATEDMRKIFTIDKQRQDHETIKQLFGEFESMDYAETWINLDGGYIIFRFIGHFSGSTEKLEIRVVLDEKERLAGLWLLPWKDKL